MVVTTSSDDEVVVGEEKEFNESKQTINNTSTSNTMNGFNNSMNGGYLNPQWKKTDASYDAVLFRFDTIENEDLFGDRHLPSDFQFGGSNKNPLYLKSSDIYKLENSYSDYVDTSDRLKSSDIS
ncbi:hypothetical protein V6N11_081655 [Hibiscus sabdariffa]|uniref:Uncharacterized protein n=2 Tax=Hibiscus sabdariffa TaxID=183260 RepID=A0ABR1ZBS1_9ROSI